VDDETALRADAVKRCREARAGGLSTDQAARAVGVSRASLYRWSRDRELKSRRPNNVRKPQWTPALAEAVEALRLDYPMWGKAKLEPLLRAQGLAVSDASVGRILKRLSNTSPRKVAAHPRRFERGGFQTVVETCYQRAIDPIAQPDRALAF
jgi:putative transposase